MNLFIITLIQNFSNIKIFYLILPNCCCLFYFFLGSNSSEIWSPKVWNVPMKLVLPFHLLPIFNRMQNERDLLVMFVTQSSPYCITLEDTKLFTLEKSVINVIYAKQSFPIKITFINIKEFIQVKSLINVKYVTIFF